MPFPRRIELHEEGPREGFQIEKQSYPINQRAELIDMLAAAGMPKIQVGSFVGPRVPAMADTAELFALLQKRPRTRYTALWLNERGFERARATPGVDLDGKLFFYPTDAFSRQNNGCSAAEMQERQENWLSLYDEAGIDIETAYVMTAFGCNLSGDVSIEALTAPVRFLRGLCERDGRPMPNIVLGDTVGWGDPASIKERVQAVRDVAPDARVGLHLHDTRGLGIANVYAALEVGVDLFEASVASLGGCPFAAHNDHLGAGNVATEEIVFLCERLGIETGIDLDALIEAARFAEDMIGRRLNGRIMHAGALGKFV